jgi:hypothetical protein
MGRLSARSADRCPTGSVLSLEQWSLVGNTAVIASPILNGPYDPPERHFELGPGGPTGEILAGRRPSESFIPVPPARKGRKAGDQEALDFDVTHERRDRNTLINKIRREVNLWRSRRYDRVTPYSRKLLEHWADPTSEDRVLFCQREAAETAVFLAEVAGRHGYPDFRRRLDEANGPHNDGLPRVALKMATGSGKAVVMAMLIAWQTIKQGLRAERRPLRQAVPGGHAGHHDPGPAAGPAAERTGELFTANVTSSRPTYGRPSTRPSSRAVERADAPSPAPAAVLRELHCKVR